MRKNDRIVHYEQVHIVAEGGKWDSGTGIVYGATYVCGRGYRSGFKPTITRKLAATCLFCLTGRKQT